MDPAISQSVRNWKYLLGFSLCFAFLIAVLPFVLGGGIFSIFGWVVGFAIAGTTGFMMFRKFKVWKEALLNAFVQQLGDWKITYPQFTFSVLERIVRLNNGKAWWCHVRVTQGPCGVTAG